MSTPTIVWVSYLLVLFLAVAIKIMTIGNNDSQNE